MKYTLFSFLIFSFCFGGIASAQETELPQGVKEIWSVSEGFDAPESAYYDSATEAVYLSQIGGEGDAKDGNGFISKLSLDGKVVQLKWVTGLNGPKGIRIHGNSLWVSDIDRVVEIDVKQAKIKATYDVPGAKFLNDVAVDATGRVYVADMIASKIITIHDGKVEVFAEGEDLESPNGLLVVGERLYVAAWGHTTDFTTKVPGRVYSIDLKTKRKELVVKESIGNLDGLEVDGEGGFVVTDWIAGKVMHIGPGGQVELLLQFGKGAADHAYLPKQKLLILPRMLDNSLHAYDLSALKPIR